MTPTLRTAVLLALLALILAGCDTARPPYTPAPHEVADYPNIVLSPGLKDIVRMKAPNVKPAANGAPMDVVVTVRSIYERPLAVEYQFLFFGPRGEQLTTNPVWHQSVFQPRDWLQLRANSISADAVDWKLNLRKLVP